MSSSPSSSSSSNPAVPEAAPAPHHELAPLSDVTCHVEVLLGSATITVRECLHMRPHGVIRLQQPAGADMQVVLNGVALANGEVVIIDESTAVRVTEILPPPSAEVTP